MLQSLRIKNFALIEDLEMICTEGLNILTGETGAGKSILIDALNILLGEKAGSAFVRVGADKAIIEGIFVAKAPVHTWLKEKEYLEEVSHSEYDETGGENFGELTVSREITKTGSRFRINSILANQSSISELKQLLLHVHAQHDARTLISSQTQLEILDGLAQADHMNNLVQLKEVYAKKILLQKELEAVQISEEERVRKLELIKFQLEELQAADIKQLDEDTELDKKKTMLANIAQLDDAANAAYYALVGGNDLPDASQNTGAIDNLQIAISSLEKASKFDASLDSLNESLNNALSLAEEAQANLRHYKDTLDSDPETLQEIEARIAQLATIKRKYGPTLSDALNKASVLQDEVDQLENVATAIEKIEGELKGINSKLNKLATTINKNRLALATKLAGQMKKELSELGMENCKFEVAFEQLSDVGPNGFDRIEFMISPNPGQPLLPLAKIASGGELSRIMLSLKSIVTGLNDPPTVIFDEIDAGLSGRTVQAVRDKLTKLSRSRQILCITHQPIIAAAAANHLFIEKQHAKDSTKVTLKVLEGKDRLQALASMAAGSSTEAAALDFAQSLLNQVSSA